MSGRSVRPPKLTGLGWGLVASVVALLVLGIAGPQRVGGLAWAVLAIMLMAWVGSWSSVRSSREARRRVRRGRGFGRLRERDDEADRDDRGRAPGDRPRA